jgi:hypothetical protein
VESSCELGNEPSGSIKCWETTEWLHNLWPLEKYSAPQSYLVELILLPICVAPPPPPNPTKFNRRYIRSGLSLCNILKSFTFYVVCVISQGSRQLDLHRTSCLYNTEHSRSLIYLSLSVSLSV